MSTHSVIGVSHSDGKITACYVHMDGYPDHMLPVLNKVSNDELRGYILVAGLSGGMRFFNPPEELETLADSGRDEILYLRDPSRDDRTGAHYTYVKRLSGGVRWRRVNWRPASWKDEEQCTQVT